MHLRFPFALVSCCALAALAGCSSSSGSTIVVHDAGADTHVTVDASIDLGVDLGVDEAATDSTIVDLGVDMGSDGGGLTCPKDAHKGDTCDLMLQNCPGTESCEYDDSVGHNNCINRPIGPASKGDPCNDATPCDRGLFCVSNHCSPACCPGDNSACGTDGTCDYGITDVLPDGATSDVIYHACDYGTFCHAFQYDCPAGQDCYFDTEPDVFSCAPPYTGDAGIAVVPNTPCNSINDCGESQICTALTSGPDAAPPPATCYLFCNLSGVANPGPASNLDGRFPADGTCTIGGTTYGTCQAISGIGGTTLGLCVP